MNVALRRVLGILDLGGSFLGLALGLTSVLQQKTVVVVIFEIPFLLLYCWGVWCGVQMLENGPRAVRMNMGFWAIQIPYFMSPIVGYLFTSGAFLLVTYAPGTSVTSFAARIGSQFQVSLLQGQPLQIGVNFLALAICIVLLVNRRRSAKGATEPPAAIAESSS